MPLHPPPSTALEPYGPDLVTGDSQTFETSNGDWAEVGAGTMLWTDTGAPAGAFHPINTVSTHVLDFTATASGTDYIELVVSGTFTAGQPYMAMMALNELTGDAGIWELEFGVEGVDEATSNQRFYPGLFASTRLASVVWTPLTDIVDPSLILRYIGSGTPQIWVGYTKVCEVRDVPAFRGLDVSEGRGSWMRVQDLHFTVVNEDILLQAVDVIQIVSGEELTLTVNEGSFTLQNLDGGMDVNATTDIDIAADQVNLLAVADVNLSADTGIINIYGPQIKMFDGAGLAVGDRPTIDPTAETGTLQAVVEALIALGVVIDGTP